MAKVTVAFFGVPDGEVYPREFAPGDEVIGDLSAVAISEGWATEEETGRESSEEELKAKNPAENKAHKTAPENK